MERFAWVNWSKVNLSSVLRGGPDWEKTLQMALVELNLVGGGGDASPVHHTRLKTKTLKKGIFRNFKLKERNLKFYNKLF